MYLSTAVLVAGIYATRALAAGTLTITNQCSETIYVVAANSQYKSATLSLVKGNDIQIGIAGLGSSVGASKDPAFYSEAVAKLIFGYSVNTDNNLLYYSVTTDYGNPLAGESFSVTSTNSQCTPVYSANGVTYACAAGSSLALTFC